MRILLDIVLYLAGGMGILLLYGGFAWLVTRYARYIGGSDDA